jgi:catechol 2,3-dioxygenase-like lactoylglutathione lyase family enzyme
MPDRAKPDPVVERPCPGGQERVDDETVDGRFDEHRIGLDHLSLGVADGAGLETWRDRLAERGIEHSPIVNGDLWDVLVFRDPDGIQLELFFMKPGAAALLAGRPGGPEAGRRRPVDPTGVADPW